MIRHVGEVKRKGWGVSIVLVLATYGLVVFLMQLAALLVVD